MYIFCILCQTVSCLSTCTACVLRWGDLSVIIFCGLSVIELLVWCLTIKFRFPLNLQLTLWSVMPHNYYVTSTCIIICLSGPTFPNKDILCLTWLKPSSQFRSFTSPPLHRIHSNLTQIILWSRLHCRKGDYPN